MPCMVMTASHACRLTGNLIGRNHTRRGLNGAIVSHLSPVDIVSLIAGVSQVLATRPDADLDPAHFSNATGRRSAEGWDDQVRHARRTCCAWVAEAGGRVISRLSARLERPEPHAAAQFTREHG
jgi:hypothetical protein